MSALSSMIKILLIRCQLHTFVGIKKQTAGIRQTVMTNPAVYFYEDNDCFRVQRRGVRKNYWME